MDIEQRVLLRVATSKDAALACDVLARAQVQTLVCGDLSQLIDELACGAGALLVAEELLSGPGIAQLSQALAAQPPWSDLALLLLARTGADSGVIAQAMERLPNVTVIERPVRVSALVTAVRSALRGRRRQYQLRDLLDGLREADQRKTEFLATLAHELRNPLAPITNALALLSRQAPPSADVGRYYELMRRQVDHMARLVSDLMEVSRITRGKLELQRVPVLLNAVINDAVELSRPLIDAAGHRLVVEVPDEMMLLTGDAVRLTQVFSNLLNNAAKYTPHGGRLRVSAQRDGRHATVTVSDSGTGIAPQMLEPIFDMFVQVGGSARQAQGGLGIGLTLVRSLVELHGGRVRATSAGLGQGATFTVTLPLLRAAVAPAGPRPDFEAPPLRRRVLVVDDNRDAADSLAELLRAMGARAEAIYGGEEALKLTAVQTPDVAVLDIGMPGMDGCELALELRRRHSSAAPLTLIALTGWGQEVDRQRIAAAGFDHHLLKPVDAAELMALLAAE